MKTAVITGGAQGIGRQISEALLKNGYNVVIAEIDAEAGQEAVEYLQHFGSTLFVPCDVSQENDVQNLIRETINHFGNIDVLVNNAGIFVNKPVTELSLDEWNKVLGVNLTAAFLCSKYAVPHLRKTKGNIINISSTRAFMSEKDTEAYSATKGGLYSLTHALAISLGPDIRVNCISPGWIEVSGLKKSAIRKELQLSAEDHSQHPAGRVGKAEDISSMVLFLISTENSFITGQNFIVDGGMTRKMMYV